MSDRRKEDKSIDEVRAREMQREPRPEEAENYAATGIFQPSENPKIGNNLPPVAHQQQGALTELRRELDAQQDTAANREGQVEFPDVEGSHDLVVGPDIGKRPHRPETGRPRKGSSA